MLAKRDYLSFTRIERVTISTSRKAPEMPNYCVNINAQDNSGDYEVHETSPTRCKHLPNPENREALGWHSDCHGAVAEAKKTYDDVNGCYYCCYDCHTT